MQDAITKRIGKMKAAELRCYLKQHVKEHDFDDTDAFDFTDEGVNCQHAQIRLYGLNWISAKAPKDWAWQLVGILGEGYSGVTREKVIAALKEEGWQKGGVVEIAEDKLIDPKIAQSVKCKGCIFFVPTGHIKKRLINSYVSAFGGDCRLHAPENNSWPEVFAVDWCGDLVLSKE